MNSSNNDDTVAIKAQYVVERHEPKLVLDCVSESDKTKLTEESPPSKKHKNSKYNKKVLKGQNKSRGPTFRQDRESTLCPKLIDVNESAEELPVCGNDKCQFIHDVNTYLASKPSDIQEECYIFNTQGYCPRGATCRFGSSHLTSNGRNIKRSENVENCNTNFLSYDCQHSLRKRTYNFGKTEQVIKQYDEKKRPPDTSSAEPKSAEGEINEPVEKTTAKGEGDQLAENITAEVTENRLGATDDSDLIRLKPEEKKKITWKNKLVLSPLTTVGNLPFRRICKEFGADVTCGEMALASSLLQGMPQEWALVRRHKTEDVFGVQVCGNNPHVMTKCAQLLEEQTDIDFIDVNLGCPIDLIYREGSGSGLLRRTRVLESILTCMNNVTDIPLTVKTRTGISKDANVVHSLMPIFSRSKVSLISIHGRTREQRYTKSADWDYIEECAKLAGDVPVFGNGDILSYEDYNEKMEKYPHINGVLIARGALYKPWLFTEIKEQRHWDISSSERMDIIKKYVNYGLEHWGSDNKGVENTRRFLLEWLSFLHRYIPVGLLEHPPQKINQRPPHYVGRDDLETLFASPNCHDWIKISEMLLGPVPEGFHFLPKHKASSWK
ncbi:tRNA-dihydrouridine(47) synthase [NAD(P)(+)]-like [Planococcus citri]|uniref:tRNA-dihydrouridine(47) synthase [NAD(P)(+)]-like n=1 Tax=Planococcus citri TaxID=170843 RepID=UPI0031F981A5